MKKLTIALFAVIVFLLQSLLMPKYTGRDQEGSLIAEYYANAGNNDVIFIGDCEVYDNFSPITLWEEYGIPSCIRGSPQQTIWQSYYLMEETFRYETPKVMIYNVLAMKYDTPESTGSSDRREAYNRMALDGMRWSISKWKSILASLTEEEKQWGGIATYLFPILRYHDRWSQLTSDDLSYLFGKEPISHNGFLMHTGVAPMTESHVEPPLKSYELGENSWYYLNKMAALCEEHGTELVLIKAPTLYPVWWWEWDSQMEAYAREKGLKYINMIEYQEEIGIDWNTDTFDTGLHLNVSGAEKASHWLGQLLSQECGLPDRRDEEELSRVWEEKCRIYQQCLEVQSSH